MLNSVAASMVFSCDRISALMTNLYLYSQESNVLIAANSQGTIKVCAKVLYSDGSAWTF